jgi:hypothetical protein
VKYTWIYGCKSGNDFENTRMFFEWTQLLLRNFDPNSMEAIFPDILSDIKGRRTEEIEIIHSAPNLPKIPVIIKGNRMIGPSVTQQKTKKQTYV